MLRAALVRALLAGSILGMGLSARQLAEGWPGSAFVDAGTARIEAGLNRHLAQAASDGRMVARLAALLEETPRNWLAIDAVEQELSRQDVAISPKLATRIETLRDRDTGARRMAAACLRCAQDVARCDFSAALLCGATVQLSPVGDVQSLSREGAAYLRGAPVDRVDMVLSAIGLSAVVLVPLTGGSSGAVKMGAGMAKLAHGMGRLPPALSRTLATAAQDGIDWARLPAGGFRSALRPERLRPALDLLGDGGRMTGAVGVAGTLHLLAHVADATDLRRLSNVAEAAPTRTVAAAEVLGTSRLLRVARRVADALYAFLGSLLALATLLASAIGNSAGRALLRIGRR